MGRYLVKRIILAIPVLIGVTVAVFVIIRLIPGTAVDLRIESANVTQEQRQALKKELGVDKPVAVQYLIWVGALARGDLGNSLRSQRPVADRIKTSVPVSVEIAILATLVTIVIAIPAGVMSAVRQDTFLDYALRLFTIGALSIPGFWLATLFLLVASKQFGWAPPAGYVPLLEDPGKNVQQFLPPALILGVGLSSIIARMIRSQMLEVLRQDFVQTARAKGLRGRSVVYRHALPNAIIPVLTLLGAQFGFLIGSTVVIESIFGLPGVGRLTLDGIVDRDYPLLQAVVLFIAVTLLTINIVVDVAYAWIDPRIRYE